MPDKAVFVVDDDAAVRQGLRFMLRAAGYGVEAFPTARSFLTDYDPRRGGCLLLDVRMPQMTGLELQQQLNVRGWRVPVIFITCAYRLCHPNVVPVETAEPSDWCDAPDCLRGAMERRILVECKVRAHPIVVGGVIRQQMPEVPFPQYHDMVEALASDRANQPFNMTVLPR